MYTIEWTIIPIETNSLQTPHLNTAYLTWVILVRHFLEHHKSKEHGIHITVYKDGKGIDFNKNREGEEGNPNTFIYWDSDFEKFIHGY